MTGSVAPPAGPRAGSRALASWCFYDWANSAFPTVVETFLFSAYFVRAVAADVEAGTASWGYALAAAGGAVALLSPVLGAVADRCGARKPWLGVATLATAVATAMLWFVEPSPDWALWALVWFALATIGFEIGTVFYNTMLPDLAPPGRLGRLSGWGWGVGYAGGLACLTAALFGLIRAEPFGLDPAVHEPVRAAMLLVAAWTVVFAVPLFLWTPDRAPEKIGLARAIRDGTAALLATIRQARHHGQVWRFLLARMIYTDGLNTVFAFGGIYAAGTFGMGFDEIVTFGIALNVTAGLGAAAFGWVDDRIGSKRTIVVALLGLLSCGAALIAVETKPWFWAFGLALGIFIGPAQAASRSMMARLVPKGMEAEMFGLYALTGKATAFLGPLALGLATVAFSSQRAGMATTLVFLGLGLALLLRVREPVSGGSGARP